MALSSSGGWYDRYYCYLSCKIGRPSVPTFTLHSLTLCKKMETLFLLPPAFLAFNGPLCSVITPPVLTNLTVKLVDSSGINDHRWAISPEKVKFKRIFVQLEAQREGRTVRIGTFNAIKERKDNGQIELSTDIEVEHAYQGQGLARFMYTTVAKRYPEFFNDSVTSIVSYWEAPGPDAFCEMYHDFMSELFFEMDFTHPKKKITYKMEFNCIHRPAELTTFPDLETVSNYMEGTFSVKMFRALFPHRRVTLKETSVVAGSHVRSVFAVSQVKKRKAAAADSSLLLGRKQGPMHM